MFVVELEFAYVCYLIAAMPTVGQSLNTYVKIYYPRLTAALFVLSFVPLPEGLLLGNRGEPLLSLVVPFFLFISSGLVVLSYGFLRLFLWPLKKRTSKPCK